MSAMGHIGRFDDRHDYHHGVGHGRWRWWKVRMTVPRGIRAVFQPGQGQCDFRVNSSERSRRGSCSQDFHWLGIPRTGLWRVRRLQDRYHNHHDWRRRWWRRKIGIARRRIGSIFQPGQSQNDLAVALTLEHDAPHSRWRVDIGRIRNRNGRE